MSDCKQYSVEVLVRGGIDLLAAIADDIDNEEEIAYGDFNVGGVSCILTRVCPNVERDWPLFMNSTVADVIATFDTFSMADPDSDTGISAGHVARENFEQAIEFVFGTRKDCEDFELPSQNYLAGISAWALSV